MHMLLALFDYRTWFASDDVSLKYSLLHKYIRRKTDIVFGLTFSICQRRSLLLSDVYTSEKTVSGKASLAVCQDRFTMAKQYKSKHNSIVYMLQLIKRSSLN